MNEEQNAELRAFFNESDIEGILKNRLISWASHEYRAEGQIIHEITVWKPDKKRPRRRPRQRWIDRVREDLMLLGIRNGEQLAKDRERCSENGDGLTRPGISKKKKNGENF